MKMKKNLSILIVVRVPVLYGLTNAMLRHKRG